MNLIDIRITASKREVKNFGFLFAGICFLATVYLFYIGSDRWTWPLTGMVFFLVTGLFGYPVLRPLYLAWMKFAYILGWLNTRLLLGMFFYLIITPIGLLLRILGKDLLDQKIDRSKKSYWKLREVKPFDPKHYERLF